MRFSMFFIFVYGSGRFLVSPGLVLSLVYYHISDNHKGLDEYQFLPIKGCMQSIKAERKFVVHDMTRTIL